MITAKEAAEKLLTKNLESVLSRIETAINTAIDIDTRDGTCACHTNVEGIPAYLEDKIAYILTHQNGYEVVSYGERLRSMSISWYKEYNKLRANQSSCQQPWDRIFNVYEYR